MQNNSMLTDLLLEASQLSPRNIVEGLGNKIIGHQPGWANKETENAIDSDFTAGMSLTGSKNALEMFRTAGRKIADRAISIKGVNALARDLGAERISRKKLALMIDVARKAKPGGRPLLGIEEQMLKTTFGGGFNVPMDAMERAIKLGDWLTPVLIKSGHIKAGGVYYGSASTLAKTPIWGFMEKSGLISKKDLKNRLKSTQKWVMVHESLEGEATRTLSDKAVRYASHFDIAVPEMEAYYLGKSGDIGLYHKMFGIRRREALLSMAGIIPGSKELGIPGVLKHLSEYSGQFRQGVENTSINIPFHSRLFYSPGVQIGVPITAGFILSGGKNKDDSPKGSNNKPISKIVPKAGWANKMSELAVDSDFSKGSSITSKVVNKAAKYLAAVRTAGLYAKPMSEGGVGIMQLMKMSSASRNRFTKLLDVDPGKAYKMLLNVDAKRAQSNLAKAVNKSGTVGLTNNVLHNRKINHTIMDQTEKTKHLFIS